MQQQRTEAAALEAEIARLRSLALDALRRRWRVVFGRTPPAPLSKDLLGRMISYMPLWAKMLPHGHRQGAGRWLPVQRPSSARQRSAKLPSG